ncbi:hypothetical protein [Brasilonema sp. UFV-L1]|uniref:hypothetical protein n=1 Tax=Brasilonema sp. UFV-L1 TaxID=2234130 RepID=UPI00145E4F10|nr:hypothetical protein [Brasilonema sp. UFV-L1]NMG10367.1 hypothetical protein [Brasilonema sp. UFV-L1]
MVESNSRAVGESSSRELGYQALSASILKARASLERIKLNTAATARAIENINRNLDAIEQRRMCHTQNELVAEELGAEEELVQWERTQTVAPILARILKVIGTNRFGGQKYTVSWEKEQLVLMRNSDSVQLMRASYNSEESHWEPVERSELTLDVVQHMQQNAQRVEQRLLYLQQEKEKSRSNRSQELSL